jgi:hypothetical protein
LELNFEKLPRFKNHAMRIWSLVPQWAHAHQVPEEAIVSQIYIAHAWADSNPKKAPKKNMTRYLDSWMKQAKRYGNLKVAPAKPVPRAPDPEGDMTVEEMREIRRQNFPQRGTLAFEFKDSLIAEAEEVK